MKCLQLMKMYDQEFQKVTQLRTLYTANCPVTNRGALFVHTLVTPGIPSGDTAQMLSLPVPLWEGIS